MKFLEENDQCSSNAIEMSPSQAVEILDVSITADPNTDILAAATSDISECHPTANNSTIVTDNSANSHLHLRTNCEECAKKVYLISIKDDTIRELRRKLKKSNTKIWYLETTKRKLGKSLSEMKQHELLDEKAYEALEVRKQI